VLAAGAHWLADREQGTWRCSASFRLAVSLRIASSGEASIGSETSHNPHTGSPFGMWAIRNREFDTTLSEPGGWRVSEG
jgi:hypothetical protein